MLLIFCLNLRKDQLKGKPGKYFLARGPVRLGGGAQGPNPGKDGTEKKCCWNFWHGLSKAVQCSQWLGIVYYNYNTVVDFIKQWNVNTVTVKKLPHYSNESRINTSHTVELASKQWHYTVLTLIPGTNARGILINKTESNICGYAKRRIQC